MEGDSSWNKVYEACKFASERSCFLVFDNYSNNVIARGNSNSADDRVPKCFVETVSYLEGCELK